MIRVDASDHQIAKLRGISREVQGEDGLADEVLNTHRLERLDGGLEQDIKLLPQSEQRVSVSPRCTLMYARLRQQAGYMELSVKGRAEDTDDDCVLMPMASPSRERLATYSSP